VSSAWRWRDTGNLERAVESAGGQEAFKPPSLRCWLRAAVGDWPTCMNGVATIELAKPRITEHLRVDGNRDGNAGNHALPTAHAQVRLTSNREVEPRVMSDLKSGRSAVRPRP
jgi:hypothetical protein